jgi:hypothetical protein
MTRRNSAVNKTLEDPEQQHHPEKPHGTSVIVVFGIFARNPLARDHLTAIPPLDSN